MKKLLITLILLCSFVALNANEYESYSEYPVEQIKIPVYEPKNFKYCGITSEYFAATGRYDDEGQEIFQYCVDIKKPDGQTADLNADYTKTGYGHECREQAINCGLFEVNNTYADAENSDLENV